MTSFVKTISMSSGSGSGSNADDYIKQHPELRRLSKSALANHMISRLGDRPFKTRKAFDEWFATTGANLPAQVEQVTSRALNRRYVPRKISYPSYSFQIDVTILWKSPRSRRDRFLLMIEMNSRKAFAKVLKGNDASEVTRVYRSLMIDTILPQIPLFSDEDHSQKGRLEHVWLVMGDKFFDNAVFTKTNEELHIFTHNVIAADEHKSVHGNPLGLIDSLTRTLKNIMKREKTALLQDEGGRTVALEWPDYLQSIIDTYNSSPHSALGGTETPEDMFKDRAGLAKMYAATREHNRRANDINVNGIIEPGAKVRIVTKKKSAVQKGLGLSLSHATHEVVSFEKGRYVLEGIDKRRFKPTDIVRVSDNARDFSKNSQNNVPKASLMREVDILTPSSGRVVVNKRRRRRADNIGRLDMFDSD